MASTSLTRANHAELDPTRQWLVLRLIGSGLLFATGAIHLDLYLTGYRTIPTIGWLFLLQVIAAFGLGATILVIEQPPRCGGGRRVRDRDPRWVHFVVAYQPLRVSRDPNHRRARGGDHRGCDVRCARRIRPSSIPRA